MESDNEVITLDEQKQIVEWADSNYTRFIPNGHGRQFKRLTDLNDIPICVWDIKKRIVDKEGLQYARPEPFFGDYIGYIKDGGQIHLHKDPNGKNEHGEELIHTRYNAIVQLPEVGGLPIYGGVTLHVKEREYVVCRSGIDLHTCERVGGPRARIVLSFGFLIPASKRMDNKGLSTLI
jgi:hypothetical protein